MANWLIKVQFNDKRLHECLSYSFKIHFYFLQKKKTSFELDYIF